MSPPRPAIDAFTSRSRPRGRLLLAGFCAWLGWLSPLEAQEEHHFLRGDSTNDGRVTLGDSVHLLSFLKGGGPPPECLAAGDVNGDEVVQLSDAVHLMQHILTGETAIPAPWPECGPAFSPLSCAAEATCEPVESPGDGGFRFFVSTEAAEADPERSTLSIGGMPGQTLSLDFAVNVLGPEKDDREEEVRVLAWSLGLQLETESVEARLVDGTLEGTDALEAVVGGVAHLEMLEDGSGAVGGAILSLILAENIVVFLPQTLLRGRIEIVVPPFQNEAARVHLRPADGVTASGQPSTLEVVDLRRGPFRPEAIPFTIEVEAADPGSLFTRGDANRDALYNVADAIFTLNGLFVGTQFFECYDAADADDDGQVDISDSIFTLGCLFLGSDCPDAPFPACGIDGNPDDDLDCERGGACG